MTIAAASNGLLRVSWGLSGDPRSGGVDLGGGFFVPVIYQYQRVPGARPDHSKGNGNLAVH